MKFQRGIGKDLLEGVLVKVRKRDNTNLTLHGLNILNHFTGLSFADVVLILFKIIVSYRINKRINSDGVMLHGY